MTIEKPSKIGGDEASATESSFIAAPLRPLSRKEAYYVSVKGCMVNDIAEVSRGLQALSLIDGNDIRPGILARAVYHGHLDVVRYLIEQEGIPLDNVTPDDVAAWPTTYPTTELFQLLVNHGWDINRNGRDRDGMIGGCLLKQICGDEALVHWCLDHGAKVKDLDDHFYRRPPLLELVASRGTLSTFKLLHSLGAKMGIGTLHHAVACAKSGDLAMVEHLVDTLGLDVNALDCDEPLPNHWGTPLCYAADNFNGGEEVVRFLLSRGADPSIRDCWGIHNAYERAKQWGNVAVSRALQEWKEENVKE